MARLFIGTVAETAIILIVVDSQPIERVHLHVLLDLATIPGQNLDNAAIETLIWFFAMAGIGGHVQVVL